MRKLLISAAALALSAGVAVANPGLEQLAASAGVSAKDFSVAQLVRLTEAQRNNDADEVRFILSQAGQGGLSRSDMGTGNVSQDAQLAAAAGVAPGLYSANELQRLIEARRNNDAEAINFLLSGGNRNGAAPADVVSPGKAQLAASLGLNPADYTLNQLIAIKAEQLSDS
jgi:hypothetical protein